MLQASYFILHLAMIAAGTYFMADMTNLILASRLESRLNPTQGQQTAPQIQSRTPVRNGRPDYRVIVQKNIFNSASTTASASNTTASPVSLPAQPVSLPPLNLSLIGTAVSNEGRPFAIIKDPKEKKQTLYRKGEKIGALTGKTADNRPRIVEIHRNKIVLLRGGKRETLEVSDKPKKNTPRRRTPARAAARSPASAGSTIRQVSEGQWVLDRRELDDALKNLPQLLTKARVIPSFKDGKPDGFRIFAIAKNSLYAKIGLQNGDILHRINGVDVKSPQNFMKVIEQLKDESRINVDLVRNNKKETFNYEIR
ncbi:MAG: type II secretion system protein GspC [Nitrospiria bacterium]